MNASLNNATAEPASDTRTEAKPADEVAVVLTVNYWEAIGRRAAKAVAQGWGAEWKSHSWDEIAEARDSYTPAAEYLAADREHLVPLWNAGEYERCDELMHACRDAWYDELTKQVRVKRKSLFIDDVGYSSEDSRMDRPPRYLLLQDGTTISGWLSYDDEGAFFTFRASVRSEQ